MTLAELAALAAKHVPGFETPVLDMGQWLEADNSPAALLMAVVVWLAKAHRPLGIWRHGGLWISTASAVQFNESEESIARAALVALLRAHGIEVEP